MSTTVKSSIVAILGGFIIGVLGRIVGLPILLTLALSILYGAFIGHLTVKRLQ